MRIDLKELTEQWIEREREFNATSLLEHDWCDSFAYYESEIITAFQDHTNIQVLDKDRFIEHLVENQDSYLITVGGCWHNSNEYSLAMSEQIETCLEGFPHRLTPNRAIAISNATDLYISRNQIEYGYITEQNMVCIDFDKVSTKGLRLDDILEQQETDLSPAHT